MRGAARAAIADAIVAISCAAMDGAARSSEFSKLDLTRATTLCADINLVPDEASTKREHRCVIAPLAQNSTANASEYMRPNGP